MSTPLRLNFTSKKVVRRMTQGIYFLFALAGPSAGADVWFCIPSSLSLTVTSPIASNTPQPSQLIAVKIPSQMKRDRTAREITALQRIAATAGSLASRFQRFIDADHPTNSPPDCRWLATSAVMGCTLKRLLEVLNLNPLPKALVLHIAMQLSEAMAFLYNMTPPMIHGDLFEGIIMLDVECREWRGFPGVVEIDYGAVRDGVGEREMACKEG